ncbi:Oidioi.mRNA.OKI2018_I69.chr1.g1360.t1.cds [Oikopleura dioica]|uniref:Oidioi.mRNA.OKI2018_I69.chr1.g1360.t1.cds n=1 Tax=Oikopleura dioica TaxID=34765 RepID=A0ABN7SR78_OIKDI|nr:Oidioi.mRNA.OKI2018_I69.chr1.g1360.t1.cds [Oikopleura dioica]
MKIFFIFFVLFSVLFSQKARNCQCTAGILRNEDGLLNCLCSEEIIWNVKEKFPDWFLHIVDKTNRDFQTKCSRKNLVDHAKKTNITVFDFFNKDATVIQGLRSDFWQITDIFESKNWSIENDDFEEEGTSETHVLLFENSFFDVKNRENITINSAFLPTKVSDKIFLSYLT